MQADVLDWGALARAMAGVQAVLHLAVATGHSGNYEDDAFNDHRFDVNLKGTFHVSRAALPHLKAQGGSVLNISATLPYLGTIAEMYAVTAVPQKKAVGAKELKAALQVVSPVCQLGRNEGTRATLQRLCYCSHAADIHTHLVGI